MEGKKSLRTATIKIVVLALVVALLPIQSRALAASITSASDTLSTIKESVAADHTIQFVTPTGVAAGETITVTFPAGFNLGSVAFGDMDLAAGATCGGAADITLAATPSGATWGAAAASQTITFTSGTGTITATHCVVIKIGDNATGGASNNQITNQSAAQNNSDAKIVIDGTMTDSGTIAVEIVGNNQLAVSATVDPSITCALSSDNGDSDGNHNTSAFGTFVIGTVDTAAGVPTWTISTNATGGYNISVRSAGNGTNAGLYSAGANYIIKSADASENASADIDVASTVGYGAQVTKTNGDAGSSATSVAAAYDQSGTTVGRLQLTAQSIASAAGPVSNATVVTTLKAKVTGLVPAGAYTDTLTYVCTGIY